MLYFQGFTSLEVIKKAHHVALYRGIRVSDKRPVLLKKIVAEPPDIEDLKHLQEEYLLLTKLPFKDVPKPLEFIDTGTQAAYVVEDEGEILLSQYLSANVLTIEQFLKLAISITEIISDLHLRGIIHKDIKPSNILFNLKKNTAKIIDFDTIIYFPWRGYDQHAIKETLAYISPEQTGRMNRLLDYRTDYYSLGITFYEMLTGKTPFKAKDAMEMVHAHLAKLPEPPEKINPYIPAVISNIILKLIAKIPEDRYQSTFGIQADLNQCLTQFKNAGNVTLFDLAKHDVSKHFIVSQKLYGRDQELLLLDKLFTQVKNGKSILLMTTGEAGIGKSSFINEIYKSIVINHGFYCVSKFDQYRVNAPYNAFIDILKTLVKQILTEDEEILKQWKAKIINVLGENVKIISNLVPDLELIIGKKSEKIQIDASAENLFYRVIKDFIQLFATHDHPLVLFFDDMQWMNFTSLKLFNFLMTSNLHHILIIGAYRSDEVSVNPALLSLLNDIQNSNLPSYKIHLKPLSTSDVEHLVADTLFTTISKVKAISSLCYEKTLGNPFFINHFLNLMYEEGLIAFNPEQGKWFWDEKRIQEMPVTANVIDLMIRKLDKFPVETKFLLTIASCIGNIFSLDLLAKLTDSSSSDTLNALWPALDAGYIIPYSGEMHSDEIHEAYTFHFLHDKIQQAAYQLLPEQDKKIIHKKIGMLMLTQSAEAIDKNIFLIVNHLNDSIELIQTQSERLELAILNFKVAQKAKESVAFLQSYQNIQTAISLLDPESWQDNYDLSLAIHNEAANLAYLMNDHKKMHEFCKIVLQNARVNLDKMMVYEIQIDTYTKLNKCYDVLEVTRKALSELNISLPSKFIKFHIAWRLIKLKIISMFRSEKNIVDSKLSADPTTVAAIRLLSQSLPAAQSTSLELFALISLIEVLISLEKGTTEKVSAAYVTCALLLFRVGDRKNTIKFIKIALQLAEKYPNQMEKSIAFLTSGGLVDPWIKPLRDTLAPLYESYQIAYDAGEVTYTGYAAFFYCAYSFWAGIELSKVMTDADLFFESIKAYKHDIPLTSMTLLQQLLDNLQAESTSTTLTGRYFNEVTWISEQHKKKNKLEIAAFHMVKMYISYLFGNYEEAIRHANRIQSNLMASTFGYSVVLFYDSLIRIAIFPTVEEKRKKDFLKRIRKNQKLLCKLAKSAPMNFLNKYYLVEAELARIKKEMKAAAKYYDKAIELAQVNQFIQEEALANELAGRFYLIYNRKIASCYLRDAFYNYKKWGANAKVNDMQMKYEGIVIETISHEKFGSQNMPLDLSTILKASQVISGEIAFDKLMKKTLKIVTENMGADRCIFLLEKNHELLIEGEYTNKGAFLHVLESLPYKDSDNLPHNIIEYVKRTKQLIKIDDVMNDQTFVNDIYLNTHNPRSILCVPLVKHGKLQGIFYFENKLAVNVFSEDRLQLLNSLSGQIAISVENSRLYEAFKRFVPQEFLNLIHKQNVVDVQLGDYMQKTISVLFMDIAGFTSLSEQLQPKKVFQFINAYLSYMEPIISLHKGFIDKYIGDGIMALFPENPDDAIAAAIALQESIEAYNQSTTIENFKVQARIGINTGPLILGTIGSKHRIDGSVIGDAVNTASRITDLNQMYGANILISEHTKMRLTQAHNYCLRMIDKVIVKGKSEIIPIWQILTDVPVDSQQELLKQYSEAWNSYAKGNFIQAKEHFNRCLHYYANDKVSEYFIKKCDELIESGVPQNWNGVTTLTTKLHF